MKYLICEAWWFFSGGGHEHSFGYLIFRIIGVDSKCWQYLTKDNYKYHLLIIFLTTGNFSLASYQIKKKICRQFIHQIFKTYSICWEENKWNSKGENNEFLLCIGWSLLWGDCISAEWRRSQSLGQRWSQETDGFSSTFSVSVKIIRKSILGELKEC